MKQSALFAAVLACALLISACGGGSGAGTAPPTISKASSPPAGTANATYAGFTFSVATGGTAPFTWTETGVLPPGLTLSSGGQLSGIPTIAGTYPVTVTVADSSSPHLTGTASVDLVIADPTIVVIGGPVPPAGTVTYPYPPFMFAVASGGSPPFTWKVAAGALPVGLVLGADGSLTGTPTSIGSSTFTVAATDSAQTPQTGLQPVTVIIGVPAALAIVTTTAPPAGVHGTAYPTYYFTANGGYLPLTWNVTGGALPTGLTLGPDGTLSGTPTAPGTFTFTAAVTDSAPTPVSTSVPNTIVVTEPPPPLITGGPLPTATINTVYPPVTFGASGGLAPLVWSATGNLAGLSFSLDGILSGTPSAAGHFPITINATDALSQPAPPAPFTLRVSLARQGTFTATGSMAARRTAHTATLLPGGKVLVAGGVGLASAELYDPVSATFGATGTMAVARAGHSAVLFTDASLPGYGKVLVVGGADATAELYDPSGGTFAVTGSMVAARNGQTATLLTTGKVLVAGGGTATAELYDPATGTFAATGSMGGMRTGHTATLLPDGTVLLAGGGTATAERYDPSNGTFSATGSMAQARARGSATRLPDGTALIAGPDNTAELFELAAGTFVPVGNLLSSRSGATASLRNDAGVLVTGGSNLVSIYAASGYSYTCNPPTVISGCRWLYAGSAPVSVAGAEMFGTESEGFTAAAALAVPRDGHTATVLADGSTVLVVGGTSHTVTYVHVSWHRYATNPVSTVLASAELFR